MATDVVLDELDHKLIQAFPGRVVRKDLVKRLKVGFNVPVYVLEYLLGKYCSTTDEEEIRLGLEQVKSAITERIVRGDQSELIKARLQRVGSMKMIDLVTARFDEKVSGGKFWAKLATAGLDNVHIDPDTVYKHERILTGGVWANIELLYDDSLGSDGAIRPFVIGRLSPIQVASANFEEFIEGRQQFSRDEWMDVLMRTMGYEPTHPDFTFRRKLLFLLRLVPLVEKNYNLIELGPRGTGKSYVYREISPYAILLSGGQGSIADLFGWKNRPDKPGLVVKYDMVAFDEVAGAHFKREVETQMYKGYMEQGSFSREMTKGRFRPTRASSSMATLTATWKRRRVSRTCSRRCRTPSATTWPFTTAGMAICPAGKCPRCSPTTLPLTWALSPTISPRFSIPNCAGAITPTPMTVISHSAAMWKSETAKRPCARCRG